MHAALTNHSTPQDIMLGSRLYAVVRTGSICIPNTYFNVSSVSVPLPEAKPGGNYTVCVKVQENNCIATQSTTLLGKFLLSCMQQASFNFQFVPG